MFLVVGKGLFLKDALLNKLQEWGFADASLIVSKAEKEERYVNGSFRVLLVKG